MDFLASFKTGKTAADYILDMRYHHARIMVAKAIGDSDWEEEAMDDSIAAICYAAQADFYQHARVIRHPAVVRCKGFDFYLEAFERLADVQLRPD